MAWAVLLALLQPAEPVTRERVTQLVEKLPGSRAELVGLGPAALRFLAETPPGEAAADVVLELKCAGLAAGVREKLRRELGMRTAPFPIAEIDERCGAFFELPVVVDLGLDQDRRNRNVALSPGPLDGVLRAALRPHGLDYAIVRGRIVISTPDRLWSHPSSRERVLGAAEMRSVRASIEKFGPEEEAALLETGAAALPYLEDALRSTDLEAERRARIVELTRRIQARRAPAPFARGLVLESQAADDLDRVALRGLREKTTTLKLESTLEGAVKMLARTAGLEADVAEAAGRIRVTVVLGDMTVLEALYFLLASFDLDAGLTGGRLRVGRTDEVRK